MGPKQEFPQDDSEGKKWTIEFFLHIPSSFLISSFAFHDLSICYYISMKIIIHASTYIYIYIQNICSIFRISASSWFTNVSTHELIHFKHVDTVLLKDSLEVGVTYNLPLVLGVL